MMMTLPFFSVDPTDLVTAVVAALQAATTLWTIHVLGVALIAYMDLSGRWTPYALCKSRPGKVWRDYLPGFRSLAWDLVVLFVPSVTACCYYQADYLFGRNAHPQDTLTVSAIKFVAGYVAGKTWATAIHYALHHPKLYRFHKRHHQKPAELVASAAWDDSAVEFAVMEVPALCLCLLVFPTPQRWWVHLLHFALHGLDGAAGHSGFKAPGFLGWIMDGEYHYYHHAHLTINYAELEFLDKLLGTHHSQDKRFVPKRVATATVKYNKQTP
jgi:hypothetical protein